MIFQWSLEKNKQTNKNLFNKSQNAGSQISCWKCSEIAQFIPQMLPPDMLIKKIKEAPAASKPEVELELPRRTPIKSLSNKI